MHVGYIIAAVLLVVLVGIYVAEAIITRRRGK